MCFADGTCAVQASLLLQLSSLAAVARESAVVSLQRHSLEMRISGMKCFGAVCKRIRVQYVVKRFCPGL